MCSTLISSLTQKIWKSLQKAHRGCLLFPSTMRVNVLGKLLPAWQETLFVNHILHETWKLLAQKTFCKFQVNLLFTLLNKNKHWLEGDDSDITFLHSLISFFVFRNVWAKIYEATLRNHSNNTDRNYPFPFKCKPKEIYTYPEWIILPVYSLFSN